MLPNQRSELSGGSADRSSRVIASVSEAIKGNGTLQAVAHPWIASLRSR